MSILLLIHPLQAVGTAVTDLRVGDRIVAHPGGRFSTHAEYIVLPASACVQIPTKAPYREAGALAFGGTTALHFLRDAAKIAPGERLLVIGAAGMCVGGGDVCAFIRVHTPTRTYPHTRTHTYTQGVLALQRFRLARHCKHT